MATFEFPASTKTKFSMWLKKVRLSRLILVLLTIMITVPLMTHYYLSTIAADGEIERHKSRLKLDHGEGYPELKPGDLKFRIDELHKIRLSVTTELRDLESKRQRLQAEISGYNSHIERLKMEYEKTNKDLEKLKLTIYQSKLEKEDIMQRNTPQILAPKRILPNLSDNVDIPSPLSPQNCRMHNCFDYSRCSLLSGFPVYFYSPESYQLTDHELNAFVKNSLTDALSNSPYVTYDPHVACIYIVIIGEIDGVITDKKELEKKLQVLPSWHGDGRNHILVNLARSGLKKDEEYNIFQGVNTGRAMLAQSTFTDDQYRVNFDIILPTALGNSDGDVWEDLPYLVPAKREILLYFEGEKSVDTENNESQTNLFQSSKQFKNIENTNGAKEFSIIKELEKIRTSAADDKFHIELKCLGEKFGDELSWSLCGTETSRKVMMQKSTFSLIVTPYNSKTVSTVVLQTRLYEALKHGAIPIVLGDDFIFPFQNLLPWKNAVVCLPMARITELHYFLRTFTDADILELRRNGRFIFETFLGTSKRITNTLLASVQQRLQIPPSPAKEEPTPSIFNGSFVPLSLEDFASEPDTADEVLGPSEPPYMSPKYQRNFSIGTTMFRQLGDPFHLYPYTPFEPVMPSEAKFLGSSYGFRPINKGAGGTGKEFSEALGGNKPREQFTVVMLTYEREPVLVTAIQRLRGLPYLNKVVVVWNSPRPPSEHLRWPEIGVEVVVVKARVNSLNNRFLPYDAIETEAILSMDDDVHLRHDEIIFGFRVWRETRDRVVGFPGRFHAWDLEHNNWLYNSNYSCELSMVLTGAAFFHKYYAYMYSYVMPQAIRDMVDEYINCEDIAMNFLVSHITRKPPIKVTSRWTFHCPGCPQALSTEDSHFLERHKCMNFFVQVYGYMPLLYTQFRVDSVLFKTRIPHEKQKCFKLI